MIIKFAKFSHIGHTHEINQDSVLEPVINGEYTLFAIADGLGGKPGGEVASKAALEVLRDAFAKSNNFEIDTLIEQVKLALQDLVQDNPEKRSMATTLTFCVCHNTTVTIGHIGDTRAYHLRGEGIMYRTKDQTELQKLLDEGVLTKTQAKVYPRKNILLSALSAAGDHEVFKNTFDILPRDRVILMSDGSYQNITLRGLSEISVGSKTIEAFVENIYNTIHGKQPGDDYSCLAVEWDD